MKQVITEAYYRLESYSKSYIIEDSNNTINAINELSTISIDDLNKDFIDNRIDYEKAIKKIISTSDSKTKIRAINEVLTKYNTLNTNVNFVKNDSTKYTNDIIKSIDNGLYAKKMGGGSVNPVTGEFNFSVAEGYIVKNGEIKEPVRGATLIGKGSEVLMNIDMVGNNLAQAQGMCGSVSGSIPTNVGQPMIRVKEITVGGRSEE
jgi:hypothetical protein